MLECQCKKRMIKKNEKKTLSISRNNIEIIIIFSLSVLCTHLDEYNNQFNLASGNN
jgi:hypothetical protein